MYNVWTNFLGLFMLNMFWVSLKNGFPFAILKFDAKTVYSTGVWMEQLLVVSIANYVTVNVVFFCHWYYFGSVIAVFCLVVMFFLTSLLKHLSTYSIYIELDLIFKDILIQYNTRTEIVYMQHNSAAFRWFQKIHCNFILNSLNIIQSITSSKMGKNSHTHKKYHQIQLGHLFLIFFVKLSRIIQVTIVCSLRRMTSKYDMNCTSYTQAIHSTFEWDGDSDFIIYYHKTILVSLSLFCWLPHHSRVKQKITGIFFIVNCQKIVHLNVSYMIQSLSVHPCNSPPPSSVLLLLLLLLKRKKREPKELNYWLWVVGFPVAIHGINNWIIAFSLRLFEQRCLQTPNPIRRDTCNAFKDTHLKCSYRAIVCIEYARPAPTI